MIEIDNHLYVKDLDHKDVVKMAVAMGAALKKLLGVCRGESMEILDIFLLGDFEV